MQHEKLFRTGGVFAAGAAPRYLRADLHLGLGSLFVGSKRLSQYGWRHSNWIEAKFFRNQAGDDGTKNSSNKSTHVGNVLADLIRLCALVPEKKEGADASMSGRYFLHCYDAQPDRYLAFRGRLWMKPLVEAGKRKVSMPSLQNEKQTIRNITGNLDDLSLTMDITNLVLEPTSTNHRPIYHCILTRIDGFTFSRGGQNCAVKPDRTVENLAVLNSVADFVASRLHVKPAEEEPPEAPEEDNPVEDAPE